jgi:hypothetical protein
MTESNTNLLKVSYPTVFKENFYFECGDGWVNLISEIAKFISSKTSKCYADQVKEKFGTLRFYISCGDGISEPEYVEIASFISAIERQSAHICEDCGVKLDDSNRNKVKSYWIKNICVTCKQKEDLEQEEQLIRRALKVNKEH